MGRRLVQGTFELFSIDAAIGAKYQAQLIKPDTIRLFPGADTKGFARFTDSGLQLECAYALTNATGRGSAVCADSDGNTYQIVF